MVAEIDDITELDIDVMSADLCTREGGFFFFVQEFWGQIISEKPVWNWHIEYLCEEAEKIIFALKDRKEKENDIIVNIPPGTSKSTVWTIMLPAWAWVIDPTLRIITISYSDTLALEHATKSRDIIRSDKYRRWFPEIELKKDKDLKSNYETTKNGQRVAAGIAGTITGMHAHLIIVDDPLNPKQAASDAECKNANQLIDTTLTTRKVDKAVTVTVLVMQRLSENDPTAHLLEKKEKLIKHICLPAEVKDGVKPAEVERKYVSGLLDPVRMSAKVLKDALTDLGSMTYAGQYGQKPAPASGAIWQRWFIPIPDVDFPDTKRMRDYGTDWDLAYTKDDDNAASAYVSAGVFNNKIYIDQVGWDWLEFPELVKYMNVRPAPHYIEAKASGKSAKQVLVKNGIAAIEVKVTGGDKIARAKMATPPAEAGLVFVRASIIDKIYNDPKQGILNFPRGKFKDLADTIAQAIQRLSLQTAEPQNLIKYF